MFAEFQDCLKVRDASIGLRQIDRSFHGTTTCDVFHELSTAGNDAARLHAGSADDSADDGRTRA